MSGESEVQFEGRDVLEAKARTTLSTGDMLITRTEGGPGFGDPLQRDAALVVADLQAGLCGASDAEMIYGVSPNDAVATLARREELRAERLAGARPVAEAIALYGSEGILGGTGS